MWHFFYAPNEKQMEFMNHWWGVNENIAPLEIAARAAVMFLIALLLIRLAGMRPFGKGESFDKIITFLIGAILSRGVVGATPFFSTVAAMIVIILLHKLFSKLSIYSKWFGAQVKGHSIVLYEKGEFLETNMHRTNITKHDVMEELHLCCQTDKLDNIREIRMERTGEISFIKNVEVQT
jgi:uncharacterized membrane protein YcaP (DUF421 family)